MKQHTLILSAASPPTAMTHVAATGDFQYNGATSNQARHVQVGVVETHALGSAHGGG